MGPRLGASASLLVSDQPIDDEALLPSSSIDVDLVPAATYGATRKIR